MESFPIDVRSSSSQNYSFQFNINWTVTPLLDYIDMIRKDWMVMDMILVHNDDTDNPKIFDAQTLTKVKSQWNKLSLFDQKLVLNNFCTTKNNEQDGFY